MLWTNYHSHTHYCDGKGSVKDYTQTAFEKGMSIYGISSHNPLPNSAEWGMKSGDFDSYLNDINAAKNAYQGQLEVLAGMEIDYFPFIKKPSQWIDHLDYWIGSIHFIDKFEDGKDWEIDGATSLFKKGYEEIFSSDIQSVVERYYDLTIEMIEKWQPPILGHLDKIKIHNRKEPFFDESEKWYMDKVEEVLAAAKTHKTVIEVNTRGLYKGVTSQPYPSYHILEMIKENEIPIMLNSDSHHTREMYEEFSNVARELRKIGFRRLSIIRRGKFEEVEFDENGIHL
jgi:histidinol-phosphatase (PHP family)